MEIEDFIFLTTRGSGKHSPYFSLVILAEKLDKEERRRKAYKKSKHKRKDTRILKRADKQITNMFSNFLNTKT